mmetsp:Transcript_7188/g.16310  ORF Transcript_7188/g.16310 Transcript_7188/m.16310 type:complete len:148 (-) Transcript_7188:26-469(-)
MIRKHVGPLTDRTHISMQLLNWTTLDYFYPASMIQRLDERGCTALKLGMSNRELSSSSLNIFERAHQTGGCGASNPEIYSQLRARLRAGHADGLNGLFVVSAHDLACNSYLSLVVERQFATLQEQSIANAPEKHSQRESLKRGQRGN